MLLAFPLESSVLTACKWIPQTQIILHHFQIHLFSPCFGYHICVGLQARQAHISFISPGCGELVGNGYSKLALLKEVLLVAELADTTQTCYGATFNRGYQGRHKEQMLPLHNY